MKKFSIGILITFVVAFLVVMIFGGSKSSEYLVVATNFPAYDFARAVVGSENVKMLLPAGTDIHHYEPSPQDVAAIQNAELVVYNGGESESWVEPLISGRDEKTTFRMMSFVNLLDESSVNDLSDTNEAGHHESDEHIWTSPVTAAKIVELIAKRASELWPEKADLFSKNAENYIDKLDAIDAEIRKVVANSKRHTLVFGDRFPFYYFTTEYGLDHQAALPGCAEEVEPDAKTMAFLTDYIRDNHIPVILKTELTSGSIADTLSTATGAKVSELNAAHNISKEDFESGKTYAEIMLDNIEVLREALR